MTQHFRRIPLDKLKALPLLHQAAILPEYEDAMGHMNVRWYSALFDSAAWKLFESFGMDAAYYRDARGGGFALQHFIHFLAEVHIGETVSIHGRILGRSARRVHFMLFMVNDTTGALAATVEVLGAHADMTTRRTAPYPPHIAAQIDAQLHEHTALDWDAPVCGVMSV